MKRGKKMSKKLISFLLAVCIIFCLSACGTTETSGNPTNTPSESQTDKPSSSDETTSTQSENSQVSSNTEDSDKKDNSQMQSSTHQSTTSNTVSQPTHTHKYADATCTSPKKCSCGQISGTALGHKFENGVCVVCKIVDEEKYVDAQVKAADNAFTDYTKYNDALKIIKAALQKFPQNNTLKTKRDYYQSFAPLYLSDIEPYTKSYWFKRCDRDIDVFKTTHYHCIRIEKNFTSADGTYDLSAKYNTFKATIYGLGDGNSGSLKIYADGVCVYSNTSISVNTRPIEIQLDITGVMDLKFEMKQDYNSYIGECFGLSNVHVQKTEK